MGSKQTNLSESIDRLAAQKAKEYQRQISEALKKSLNPFWRAKEAGDHYSREDIKNVVTAYLEHGSDINTNMPEPTDELLAAFRSSVLESILKSVPAITEIVRMQDGESVSS